MSHMRLPCRALPGAQIVRTALGVRLFLSPTGVLKHICRSRARANGSCGKPPQLIFRMAHRLPSLTGNMRLVGTVTFWHDMVARAQVLTPRRAGSASLAGWTQRCVAGQIRWQTIVSSWEPLKHDWNNAARRFPRLGSTFMGPTPHLPRPFRASTNISG